MSESPCFQRAEPTIRGWITSLRAIAISGGDPRRTRHRVGPIGFLRFMNAEHERRRERGTIDEILWTAVSSGEPVETRFEAMGPLQFQQPTDAIELWTERELAAVHALWRLGVICDDESHRRRALDAATWHLTHTQPDNATGHPWAIPVFLDLWWLDTGSDRGLDARLYAETLLHNCRTLNGKPDGLSALILLDAADGLESLVGSG